MVERIAQIVVLAEDAEQANLARHYLIRCGHHQRNIVVRLAPQGQGSGEQYVRERYPLEVAYYRNRSTSRKAALMVGPDCDTGTVEEHERELDRALVASSEAKREAAEEIALLLPKRNIETRVLCLSGGAVDEVTNYKGTRNNGALIKPAAVTLYEWSRTGSTVPASCVPSLRKGLIEVRRIG